MSPASISIDVSRKALVRRALKKEPANSSPDMNPPQPSDGPPPLPPGYTIAADGSIEPSKELMRGNHHSWKANYSLATLWTEKSTTPAVVDSGSRMSLIGTSTLGRHYPSARIHYLPDGETTVEHPFGTELATDIYVKLRLNFKTSMFRSLEIKGDFLVLTGLGVDADPVILGTDLLEKYKATITHGNGSGELFLRDSRGKHKVPLKTPKPRFERTSNERKIKFLFVLCS